MKKYYLRDIETGFKHEVTKEQWENFLKQWEMTIPRVDYPTTVPIIFGTAGIELVDADFFYHPDDKKGPGD